eukprot:CAMPEP_0181325822 /NCGR_PEP_ID=MMETSP1101-20121128/21147_1 /TAXON_ID=46948 /ORGANISM="Rhodomonas abbreviata, Strain Caron Lab Isolate" /LENGTH=72 /DNA_ID=CAMNT_0023434189 /DNA_START=152 /DNA_END=370 /DNA_ORIENTATION=+
MFALIRQMLQEDDDDNVAGAIAAATAGPGALPPLGDWVDGLIADPFVESCGPIHNDCDGTTYLDRSPVVISG